MFDVAPTELLLVAAVALIVIGPKDLPRVMRTVGRWVGKARGVASHFRSGFDQMVRDAELEEMEKRWASENARIMREHPAPAEPDALPAPLAVEAADAGDPAPAISGGVNMPPYQYDDTEPTGPGADAPAPQSGDAPAIDTPPPAARPLP